MNIDLTPVRTGQISYADLIRDIHYADLYQMTDELFDALELLLAGSTDAAIIFVPRDPAASDDSEQGWPVSHIVAHMTAVQEMAATGAMLLARGMLPEERLPSAEVPWETLSTQQAVQARLQESRRMCRALLDAWPDSPRLDITRTIIPVFGAINAIGLYAFGIAHSQQHIDQIRETIRQYDVSSNV